MERKNIKLNSSRSEEDVNVNSFSNVNFHGINKELPPGEINHIVDVGERFSLERSICTNYRFIFTIAPIFSNPLMNPLGQPKFLGNQSTYGLNIFDDGIFKTKPFSNQTYQYSYVDLNYIEAVNDKLIEKDGWFGFDDPDVTSVGLRKFFDIEPTRGRFDLNSNIKKNWDICITYPESINTEHHLVKGGLLIVNLETNVEAGGRKMIALGTASRHGLSKGDKVSISGTPYTQLNKEFTVKRVGLDNGDYKENYFVVDVNPDTIGAQSSIIGARMRRIANGYPSDYYLRKFKKFKNIDYSIYPLAFSNTIFNDSNYQITFNTEVNIEELKDNLGRPLSEVFLTFVKTRDGNFMSEIKSGLDLEYLSGNLADPQLSNIRRIHNGSNLPFDTHTPLPGESNLIMNPQDTDDSFYGDLVEYNKTELVENVLSDVLHRFNTSNRDSSTQTGNLSKGPRREGYMYKPHHNIPIRLYSLFIEQGYTANTVNIPDYAEELDGGKFIWRDLLSIGVPRSDGEILDYPFTNNSHYIYDNICFVGKRQDPFNLYGLYYSGNEEDNDPADPRGETITDKFITKSSEDVC